MKIKEIKEFVDAYFGIDISSKSQEREINDCRYMYYYLCLKYSKVKTYVKIGMLVGKHYASVLNGLNNFRDYMKTDIGFNNSFTKLENSFKQKFSMELTNHEYIINPNTQDYLMTIRKYNSRIKGYKKRIEQLKNKCYKLQIKVNSIAN